MWIEKHGAVWRIREQVNGSKVTLAGGFTTKTAAKNAKKLLDADQIRGNYIDPRGGQTFLADWVAMYWPAHESSLKPAVKISEGGRVRNHILPAFGALKLAEIETTVIQQWVSDMLTGVRPSCDGRKLAPKTVSNIHGTMYGIMQAAVDKKLIPANPCAKTTLPGRTHTEMRFLSSEEIERLLGALPYHWRPLVLLLISTGLRWGEAIALRVGRVDLNAGTVLVLETLHELPGLGMVFSEPKTKESRRKVTMGKAATDALIPLCEGKKPGDLVFTTPRGTAVRTRHFRARVWQRALVTADIEGTRIHDLRHTAVAHLIAANVALTAIQRRMGHSSITITSDLYGHLLPVVDASVMKAVDDSLPNGIGGIMGETAPKQPGATRSNEEQSAGQDESEGGDQAA